MRRMKNDYDFLDDRFLSLKQQYDNLQVDYNKDKSFYEEALEARMNQLEQLENENDMLKGQLEDSHRKNLDIHERAEKINFDNEMMQKNINSNTYSREVLTKKEEDFLKELRST